MNELAEAFYNVYNKADDISVIKSPLRICPLGAHIDHQDGMVTGMALDSSVNMVYAPGDDGYIQVTIPIMCRKWFRGSGAIIYAARCYLLSAIML